jgi:hypothetical protein
MNNINDFIFDDVQKTHYSDCECDDCGLTPINELQEKRQDTMTDILLATLTSNNQLSKELRQQLSIIDCLIDDHTRGD